MLYDLYSLYIWDNLELFWTFYEGWRMNITRNIVEIVKCLIFKIRKNFEV